MAFPKKKGQGKGDLYVKIFVDYPEQEGLKIQKQLKKIPLEKQKIYVKQFRKAIYPQVLKFEKKMQELKEKMSK